MTSSSYVYLWLDENNIPYYVGKGKDNRAFVKHKGRKRCVLRPNKDKIRVLWKGISPWTSYLREWELINFFGRRIKGGLLENICPSGGYDPTGDVRTTEQKNHLSKIRTGTPSPLKGKPGSPFICYTEEARERHLEGSRRGGHSNKGRKHTNETIEKNRSSQRKTYLITFPDGTEKVVKGLDVFSEEHKLNLSCLRDVSRGRQKQHKGFKVSRVE